MKGGYWYLWVLFVYYLISYLLANGGQITKYLVALIIWLVVHHLVSQVPLHISDTLSIVQIERFFPYFLAGNAVKRFGLHHFFFENTVVFVICTLVWLLHCLMPTSFILSYLIPLAAIISIIGVCRIIEQVSIGKIRGSLAYIGGNTMYIYVFHYFVIQCFRTTYFYDVLPIHSTLGWDMLLCVIPAAVCISFSVVVGKVCQSQKQIMKYVFGK